MEIYNLKPQVLTNDDNCATLDTDAGGAAKPFCVTAMKPAVKTKNRVNIFINGKFDFSFDVAQVVDFKLKVGKLLSEKELAECRRASEFGKLYQRALEYVLTRPRSIKETREHFDHVRRNRELQNIQAAKNRERLKNETVKERELRKEREEKYGGFLRTRNVSIPTHEDIEAVIERLVTKGYLDDEKFARFYFENRNVKKGISQKRLKMELSKKGVSGQIIARVLESAPRDDAEEIQKIIAKKSRKYSKSKLIEYLVRQGFDYQQSKAAVLETDSQNWE